MRKQGISWASVVQQDPRPMRAQRDWQAERREDVKSGMLLSREGMDELID